jgi:hypothetical protein
LFLLAALSAVCQPPTAILERISPKPAIASLRLDEAFATTLIATRLSGGLEISSCDSRLPFLELSAGMQVKQVLDKIRRYRPELTLDPAENDAVSLISRGFVTGLLDTRIDVLRLSNIDSRGGTINELLLIPAVQRRIAELDLEEGLRQFGFERMNKSGIPSPPTPLILNNVTLRQALNAIALRGEGRVWIYDENICRNRRVFTLRFSSW